MQEFNDKTTHLIDRYYVHETCKKFGDYINLKLYHT